MVTELILEVFFGLFDLLLFLIPNFNAGILSQQLGSFAGMVELIAKSSFFVPWSTLLINVAIVVAFYGFTFTLSVANWIIAKIPTIS